MALNSSSGIDIIVTFDSEVLGPGYSAAADTMRRAYTIIKLIVNCMGACLRKEAGAAPVGSVT